MKNRILIISHNPFSKVSNNGKTLEAIFSKFDREELSQLYFVEVDLDHEYAGTYFYISDIDVAKSLVGKKIENNFFSKKPATIKFKSNDASSVVRFLRKHSQTFAFFRDLMWQTVRPEETDPVLRWIKEVNPDFIFFVAGNQVSTYKMVRFLAAKFNMKYGVYFTDDYFIYPRQNNVIKKIQNIRVRRSCAEMVQGASICFAIGEMMAEEYTKYFGRKFVPLMNMVDTNNPVLTETRNQKFIISYFGGLHLNRWKMLAEFSSELDATTAVLQVYSHQALTAEMSEAFRKTNVVFKGGICEEQMTDAIGQSDALIHVESDAKEFRSLTKLSVSTKIPEYLNTNKLVIAYGPADIASIKLIADNSLGLVINSQNEIKEKISYILRNPSQIVRLSQAARKFASANFDIEKNSKDFREWIEKVLHNAN